jgi:hypothetical protein
LFQHHGAVSGFLYDRVSSAQQSLLISFTQNLPFHSL